MKVAVVGATGLVGQQMLDRLLALQYPVDRLLPVASPASVGKPLRFGQQEVEVLSMEAALNARPDLALFSAGGSLSREWAPRFAEAGTCVIDNSSAWRMEPGVPLVVPEVNVHDANGKLLIANPNCSTIQLVVVLKPLHEAFGLKRVVVSTYQAVTGTGQKAVAQLEAERQGQAHNGGSPYPYAIDRNVIPQCDVFAQDGYTKEELKVVNETRKILGLPNLRITCTAARVPVLGGHSEAVNLELEQSFSLGDVFEVLKQAPGVVLMDDPERLLYPMPILAQGRDDVLVGRIRRDFSLDNGLNLWIVADNLRKGAATNAVQIAKALLPANQ